jgi:hypothetical protein
MKIKSRFSIGTFSIENSNSKNQISSHPGILLYHERTGTYKIRITIRVTFLYHKILFLLLASCLPCCLLLSPMHHSKPFIRTDTHPKGEGHLMYMKETASKRFDWHCFRVYYRYRYRCRFIIPALILI